MIQIKPIALGLPSKQANFLLVRPIMKSTQETSCTTYYEVVAKENESSYVVAMGNCPISEEQYAEWGSDNTYIEDIVLDYLGLEREILTNK
jgi:Ni,Fe-hydrogenase III small subunit